MATNNIINLNAAGVATYDGLGAFTASALTQYSILIGGAADAIVSLGAATNGQLPIGSTGIAPVLGTLTAGTGVSISNSAGAITINAIGAALSWTDASDAAQAIAIDNGYTANRGTLVTLTLPAVAAYGSVVAVVGKGVGLWTVAQNAGQTIHFGSVNSTPGAGGSISSTAQYDVIVLLCSVANDEWTVMSSIGNLTIV